MKRRRMRRYHSMKKNSGMKFFGFIGIMLGAVICGYMTARFIVAPLLGYETEVLKLDFPSKMTSLIEKEESEENEDNKNVVVPEASEKTYALQFGVFSSKDGAEQLQKNLEKKNIPAEIREIDQKYKVLKGSYETKEEALSALEALKDKSDIDVFITVLTE